MNPTPSSSPSQQSYGGVIPALSMASDLGPPRSELGVGGLMPWCGKLYVVLYLSHTKRTGSGAGLYVIDEAMCLHKHPAGVDGTYANRMVHFESNQMILGPHVIDPQHNVRTVTELVDVRTSGTATHLTEPENLVYVLGMEGELFELNVHSLETRQIFDLVAELGVKSTEKAHFKACYTAHGRLVVANNSYEEEDHTGERADGRLAEFDGKTWKVLERVPFVEVNGRGVFADTIFATGWDRASALLKVFTARDQSWKRYRLPKASHCYEHAWQTEWPRIREIEHERFLLDIHGMFYELTPHAFDGAIWGVRPISSHLAVYGDFCSWRGMLVLGPDNASPGGRNHVLHTAEAQVGCIFGKTDDLWQYGPRTGWGGPWWKTAVVAKEPSDPFLMTGFSRACLHLDHDAVRETTFTIEADILGNGTWRELAKVSTASYVPYVFPEGFSAHWFRVRADTDCVATAQVHYT